MEIESEKIIEEQVKKLPQEVKDALASENLHNSVVAIGQKHHLHVDQVGLLENEVVLVMMGLVNPVDLPGELVKELAIETTVADSIAGEVSNSIFMPIREAMKNITGWSSSDQVEKWILVASECLESLQSNNS